MRIFAHNYQDANLKRCFGKEDKIIDCDWSYIKTLQTLKEPREPMPRFIDLLEYLASPGLEDVWVLLDIKVMWITLTQQIKKTMLTMQHSSIMTQMI